MRIALRRAAVGLIVSLSSQAALAGPVRAQGSTPPPKPVAEDKVVVFAAASLQDAFGKLAEEFKRARPDVDVTFNFAGTQELRTQLEHGAPVDVFASADLKHMDALVAAARVDRPVVFTGNEPVVVVARESAGKIRSFADLPSADRIVLGVPEVPIGRYTLQILGRASEELGTDFRARVEAKVVSRELNVRQVLAKVSLGEAQAGIVYRTDARSSGEDVSVVAIPSEFNVIADYPIAVVVGAPHPSLARAWVDFITSERGQRMLGEAGFLAPSAVSPRPE
jgi:molybdate transport system substrate-binding protein